MAQLYETETPKVQQSRDWKSYRICLDDLPELDLDQGGTFSEKDFRNIIEEQRLSSQSSEPSENELSKIAECWEEAFDIRSGVDTQCDENCFFTSTQFPEETSAVIMDGQPNMDLRIIKPLQLQAGETQSSNFYLTMDESGYSSAGTSTCMDYKDKTKEIDILSQTHENEIARNAKDDSEDYGSDSDTVSVESYSYFESDDDRTDSHTMHTPTPPSAEGPASPAIRNTFTSSNRKDYNHDDTRSGSSSEVSSDGELRDPNFSYTNGYKYKKRKWSSNRLNNATKKKQRKLQMQKQDGSNKENVSLNTRFSMRLRSRKSRIR